MKSRTITCIFTTLVLGIDVHKIPHRIDYNINYLYRVFDLFVDKNDVSN